jgi:serine/threonine-protein kinase
MGAVYRAREIKSGRPVAIKIVEAGLLPDAGARRRFAYEADMIARLQHPAIVAILDRGTLEDGGSYLVMELVDGEDLRRLLVREGRLDLARAIGILSSICRGVEAAHREGVLHRDIKPENILVTDNEIEAKVLDFGMANAIDGWLHAAPDDRPPIDLLTAPRAIVGTPAYMAPEQLRGLPTDGRADVFSLGVVTYEMLAGELPFGRGSLAAVMLAQGCGARALPQDAAPPAVERAIRTALNADADRRPASPQAFAHLVRAAAGFGAGGAGRALP